MQDVYKQILTISTIAIIVTASVALLMMNFFRSGRTVDESRAWLACLSLRRQFRQMENTKKPAKIHQPRQLSDLISIVYVFHLLSTFDSTQTVRLSMRVGLEYQYQEVFQCVQNALKSKNSAVY